jgi:hypothetical protein
LLWCLCYSPADGAKLALALSHRSRLHRQDEHTRRATELSGTPVTYSVALMVTVALEAPLYSLMLRQLCSIPPRVGFIRGTMVNLVSHPLGFLLVAPLLLPLLGFPVALLAVEVVVVVVEALILWTRHQREPLVLGAMSVVANGISFLAGMLIIR